MADSFLYDSNSILPRLGLRIFGKNVSSTDEKTAEIAEYNRNRRQSLTIYPGSSSFSTTTESG